MIVRIENIKDKVHILHYARCDDIIESNKELAKLSGWDEKKNMRHVARLPILEYYNMIKDYPEITKADYELRQKALKRALVSDRYSIWRLRSL